ncbi:hypothetical protein HN51_048283 [Arachis hypogaea]
MTPGEKRQKKEEIEGAPPPSPIFSGDVADDARSDLRHQWCSDEDDERDSTRSDLRHQWCSAPNTEMSKRQLHRRREEASGLLRRVSPIVAKPSPLLAAVLPWNHDSGIMEPI